MSSTPVPPCSTCGDAFNVIAESPDASVLALCSNCGTIRSFIRDETTGALHVVHTDELTRQERVMFDELRRRSVDPARGKS